MWVAENYPLIRNDQGIDAELRVVDLLLDVKLYPVARALNSSDIIWGLSIFINQLEQNVCLRLSWQP